MMMKMINAVLEYFATVQTVSLPFTRMCKPSYLCLLRSASRHQLVPVTVARL